MSDNTSDYTLARTDVHAMLPIVNQNPLLKAISESTFNRFLTKPELTRVIGTIGATSRTSTDQIVESTIFDQAFQLQPAIINSTTSVTDIITYKDLQRTGERMGINFDAADKWQDTEQFNYCPPINLDKLINFRNYYWVDLSSTPQYIVIANKQIEMQARLSQMVVQYLILSTSHDKLQLWNKIKDLLDIVHTVVLSDDVLVIPNLNLVVNDAVHAPYIPMIRTDVDKTDYALASDWAKANRWVHRLDLDDVSSATMAILPIIEYNDTLPLTQWTFTRHVWEYRKSTAYPWTATESRPSNQELFSLPSIPTTTSMGDTWLGFEQHWKYIRAEAPVPVVAQEQYIPSNPSDITKTVATDGQTLFTTNLPIPLGKNILRVYVDGVRQYGTYKEASSTTIEFYDPVVAGANVTIYTTVSALSDVYTSVQSGTTVSTTFSKDSVEIAGVLTNLVEYRFDDQYKQTDNDYPQFDLVDKDGIPLYESSSIFAFAEDSSYPVHPVLGKRVVHDVLARDYGFATGLVSKSGEFKFFNDAKAGICSIWCKENSQTKYVPHKVDAARAPSTDGAAVWEIPAPFMNNIHHESRSQMMLSELFIHFQSIIAAQTITDEAKALYGEGNTHTYRLNDAINYGAGGTIKEYNGSFDNFVSALISSDYSTLDVIDFAAREYQRQLTSVRKFVESSIFGVLTDSRAAVQNDLVGTLMTMVLDFIQQDAIQGKLYNDSGASIASVVKNWVATLPYLRLKTAVEPYIVRADKLNMVYFTHHDGHTSVEELGTTNSLFATLVGSLPPTDIAPTSTLGALWYSSTTGVLQRYNGTTWIILDPTELVLNVLLAIETALYVGAPNVAPTYSITTIKSNNSVEYTTLSRLEFETYCKDQHIIDPYKGDYIPTDPFTWNYGNVVVYSPPDASDSGSGTILVGTNALMYQKLSTCWAPRWYDIYKNFYGTALPHLEPWKLQGYSMKPTWWDGMYKASNRRWTSTMWANINTGIIPVGNLTPQGIVSTGIANEAIAVPNTSVNTSDRTIGGYAPDDLLPPYWPFDTRDPATPTIGNNQCLLNSLFDFAAARVSSNQYPFGKNGPTEYMWKRSIGFNYSELKIAFKLDPVRFLSSTFGEDYTLVQGLQVCNRTNNVLSHKNVLFHGDIDASGTRQYFAGLNQWYVQFFRSMALYGNGSTAQRVWTNWTTQLSYNIGSFVVDNTMSITSPKMDITSNDYTIKLKKAAKVRELWVDGLYVTVAQSGSFRELPQGAGRDWVFQVSLYNPVIRDTKYYGVKKYRLQANVATNTFVMLEGSLSEAGWNNGSAIMLDTGVNGMLPNAVDDTSYYFIIPIDDTTFSVATSKADAENGIAASLLTTGSGTYYAAELDSTFLAREAANTATLWKHFVVNKNDVRTFSSNIILTGVQNVVDFVDGYVHYLTDQGLIFNDSSVPEYDANDRLINWQYELESFINYLYLQVGTTNTFNANSIAYQVGEIELNPFRNNLWVSHPVGVVSEFNSVQNTNAQAFVYDRSGNKVSNRDFHVLRLDNKTQFTTLTVDDATIQASFATNNYSTDVGIAGVHMFFDEYEHIILFNPYTIEKSLVYDPFLGIAIPRVHTYFEKQTVSTKRPNVGGFVLQNGSLTQNYEYTVSNIQQYYDTFTVNENANFVNNARAMLGYRSDASYFVGSTATPKSQFLFYKGMIKAKGTSASITAYTSANQAATAEVDEFWAYKAFEFGDNRTNQSYTINLRTDDTSGSHIKFQFVQTPTSVADQDFMKIAISDATRWTNFPSQLGYLSMVPTLFGTKPTHNFAATDTTAPAFIGMPTTKFKKFIGIGNYAGSTLIVHDPALSISVVFADPGVGTRAFKNILGTPGVATEIAFLGGFSYTPGVNNIDVYVNSVLVDPRLYHETSTNSINYTFPLEILPTNQQQKEYVIVVVRKVGTYLEGSVNHYDRLNNRTIIVKDGINTDHLQIITHSADYSNCTPVKIYDQQSKVVVADIGAWDPAHNQDNPALSQVVNINAGSDQAKYNFNPEAQFTDLRTYWSLAEVGTIWKDTASYEFVPYTDISLPTSARLSQWGRLADWSDAAIYQWTQSTVPPSKWDNTNGTPRREVYGRSRTILNITAVDKDSASFTVTNADALVQNTEVVLFGDTLPTPMTPNTIYLVSNNTAGVLVLTERDGTALELVDAGSGDMRIVAASYGSTWTKVIQQVEHHEMLEVDFRALTLATDIADHEEVAIYGNGIYMQDSVVVNGIVALEADIFGPLESKVVQYRLTLVTKTGILDGLPSIKPVDLDVNETSSQWYTDTPYTKVNRIAQNSIAQEPLYYFWVRGLVNGNTSSMPMAYMEYLISNNDNPYLACMDSVVIDGRNYLAQLVIAGVHGLVSEDDRYVLRLIKNDTMRDSTTNTAGERLQQVHSQWIMFRQNQTDNVARELWDRITESIVGYSLDDANFPIPSLDRAIYDAQHSTNTRFGLSRGQAFVDGKQALTTITSILTSSDIDYTPIDIDSFLDRYNMSNAQNVIACMNALYATFPAKHVNRIFFAVMHDALSNHRVDYSGNLMKTSAISLSGTVALNVNGSLDE